MMQLAQRAGYFDQYIDDPGRIESVVIAEPNKANYEKLISLALVEGDFDNEWKNSVAIICNQSCQKWRKVMVINFNTGKATFRSLTSDPAYRFCYQRQTADGWLLDRAMLDAHPTAFVNWIDYLQSIKW